MRFVLVVSLLVSCVSSTQLVRSWRDPSQPAHAHHKPFVVAVSNKPLVREKIEDELIRRLREIRVDAVASHGLLSDREFDVESVESKLRSTDCDSVIVTHLVDTKLETTVVSDRSYASMPLDYPRVADRWTGYYTHSWATVNDPSYTVETKKFVLETSLFDAKTEKRVWSVVTETEEAATLDAAVETFAGVIVKDVIANRLF